MFDSTEVQWVHFDVVPFHYKPHPPPLPPGGKGKKIKINIYIHSCCTLIWSTFSFFCFKKKNSVRVRLLLSFQLQIQKLFDARLQNETTVSSCSALNLLSKSHLVEIPWCSCKNLRLRFCLQAARFRQGSFSWNGRQVVSHIDKYSLVVWNICYSALLSLSLSVEHFRWSFMCWHWWLNKILIIGFQWLMLTC